MLQHVNVTLLMVSEKNEALWVCVNLYSTGSLFRLYFSREEVGDQLQ